jgi:hypothetical protein
MTIWIYVNTNVPVGDPAHLKVFDSQDAAEAWLAVNDPEGLAFELTSRKAHDRFQLLVRGPD